MQDKAPLVAVKPHVRLGVRGLPSLTNSMTPGGLYVLVAETAATRLPLLAGNLASALKDGRRCSIIVPGHAEQFVHRMSSIAQESLQSALGADQCQVLEGLAEFPKKMFRFGAERFVQELEQFGVRDDDYLVFDQADELLSLHDISLASDQVAVLSRWLLQHRVTALLVFLRITEAAGATLNALMDNLTGVARLGSDGQGLLLSFDYWQSPEGVVAARSYPLGRLPTGQYEALASAAPLAGAVQGAQPDASAALEAPAAEGPTLYFYMDPDLGSLSAQVPGEWQLTDSLLGMLHATRNHRRAVIILCYQQNTNLRRMAEAVHTLRINLGAHVQIIVQEKNASLRYQNEVLLLRLGINLVIYRDVPLARMPLLLESAAGQAFQRDVNIDFEAALASVTPSHLRGYLAPARFGREVDGLLDRSTTLNIPFVLAVGLLREDHAVIDVLSGIRQSRPGDIVSADNRRCYIFLYACQQQAVLPALERMLGVAPDAVFDELEFYTTREQLSVPLDGLMHCAQMGLALDYTAHLPLASGEAQPGDVTQAPTGAGAASTPDVVATTIAAPRYASPGRAPMATAQRAARPVAEVSPVAPAAAMPLASRAAPSAERPMPSAPTAQANAPVAPSRTGVARDAYGRNEAPPARRSLPKR